jgi:hypothetical protein
VQVYYRGSLLRYTFHLAERSSSSSVRSLSVGSTALFLFTGPMALNNHKLGPGLPVVRFVA